MKTCRICEAEFTPRYRKANKYCGMACYRIAQKRGDYIGSRVTPTKIQCDNCGEPHVPTYSKKRDGSPADRHFCSRSCYLVAHKKKPRWVCAGCGIEKRVGRHHAANRKYCSHECRVASRKPPPVECKNCGVAFSGIAFRYNGKVIAKGSRSTCSRACHLAWIRNNEERKAKISKAFTGPNHPNWLGGKSAVNDRSHRGRGWFKIRKKVRDRDGNRCVKCGATPEENGRALSVHHIEPYRNFQTARQANRMSNLTTLCQSCHRVEEWKISTKQMTLHLKIA